MLRLRMRGVEQVDSGRLGCLTIPRISGHARFGMHASVIRGVGVGQAFTGPHTSLARWALTVACLVQVQVLKAHHRKRTYPFALSGVTEVIKQAQYSVGCMYAPASVADLGYLEALARRSNCGRGRPAHCRSCAGGGGGQQEHSG